MSQGGSTPSGRAKHHQVRQVTRKPTKPKQSKGKNRKVSAPSANGKKASKPGRRPTLMFAAQHPPASVIGRRAARNEVPKYRKHAKVRDAYDRKHETRNDKVPHSVIGRNPVMSLSKPVRDWIEALQNPGKSLGVKIPFHINNAVTKNSLCVRTSGVLTQDVAADQTIQVSLGAGHIGGAQDVLHSFSYLSPRMLVPAGEGSQRVMGPCGDGTYVAACGVISPGTLGSAGIASNTVGSVAMSWEASPPFNASSSLSSVLRWRMVSLKLTVSNITTYTNRGGYVTSVMPQRARLDVINQNMLSGEPTYVEWGTQIDNGRCDCGFDSGQVMGAEADHQSDCSSRALYWLPRGRDLAFWSPSASADASAMHLGMQVFLNNPAGSPVQSYRIHYVANWEIAGTAVRTLTTPAINDPESAEVLLPMIGSAFDAGGAVEELGALAVVAKASQDTGYNQVVQAGMGLINSALEYAPSVDAIAKSLLSETTATTVLETIGAMVL